MDDRSGDLLGMSYRIAYDIGCCAGGIAGIAG
jgi:hypothetical protein